MFLDKIVKSKQEALAAARRAVSYQELEGRIVPPASPHLFRKGLERAKVTLIAEVKKASPSRGLLCPDFDPQSLATLYTENGAGAISVLTEEKFFLGSLDYLKTVKQNTTLPVLRKDFIIDEYQILESAVWQADAVLLIAALLDQVQIKDYLDLAGELGLDCLTEAHNYQELELALNGGAPIIGINNRDLKTFKVDLKTSLELVQEIPGDRIAVSESGIFVQDDVERLVAAGFKGILVGEAIVKAADQAAKIKELALL